MTSIPTRLRVNIRDLWETESAPLQTAFKEVKEMIGYPVEVSIEWAILWARLHESYPDYATFVTAIVNIVLGWCNALKTIAEDENNDEWTDTLLDQLNKHHQLKVILDACLCSQTSFKDLLLIHVIISQVGDCDRPTTRWMRDLHLFQVHMPKKFDLTIASIASGFGTDFLSAFDKTTDFNTNSLAEHVVDDSWDTLNMMSAQNQKGVIIRQATQKANTKELPAINMLPQPDTLFLRPPYYLIIHQSSEKNILIQCSHEPSLQLLSDYLTKYCKKNEMSSKRLPVVEIKLCESPIGFGLAYDKLELPVDQQIPYRLSAPILLNMIEAVLGYKMVYGDASSWTFKKG